MPLAASRAVLIDKLDANRVLHDVRFLLSQIQHKTLIRVHSLAAARCFTVLAEAVGALPQ